MEVEMARFDGQQAEAVPGMVRVRVADVATLARRYERLGLRVLAQTRDQAVIELPSGVSLVLTRHAPVRRVPVAA
jgi:hypothetical protein